MRGLIRCLASSLSLLVAPMSIAQDRVDRHGQQRLDRHRSEKVDRHARKRVAGMRRNPQLRVRRGGEDRELDMTVKSVELVNYRIVESEAPTPEQLRIREGRLER
jgi:hypothetical protein